MMLTVTNNLATHLVIPRGLITGKSLILRPKGTPKGTVQVEASTGTLLDAERNGLVTIQDSGGAKEPEDDSVREAPAAGRTGRTGRTGPKPKGKKKRLEQVRLQQVRLPQILALAGEGKFQREIAQTLGITRSMVQKALDKHRKSSDRDKE